jgi:hypothetical protein
MSLESPFARDTSALTALLTSGGDERLAANPATGRNVYGLAALPAADEVHFCSSTASPISARGLAAATEAWRAARMSAPEGFDEIRGRVAAYALSPDADCILAASGTELEFLALALALAACGRPIENIVVAPRETGRGSIVAADGLHFLDSAPHGAARKGARLDGWERADLRAVGVEIRHPDGLPRAAREVDAEIEARARAALAEGRGVIAHLLDVSKTGRQGLSRQAASRIVALAPDRVFIVADCCQLRSSPAGLRSLVEAGFLVAVTGSKFAGGPPFSGALLTPRGLLDRADPTALPSGLSAYTSASHWPRRMAASLTRITTAGANFGLGLRWIAALAEMERFASVPTSLAAEAVSRFATEIARRAAEVPGLRVLAEEGGAAAEWARTIVPIVVQGADGSPLSLDAARAIQRALRAPRAAHPAARGFHLGQPVAIGSDSALRVCMSAPMINAFADRVAAGASVDAAFAPIGEDLRELFESWRNLGSAPSFASGPCESESAYRY